jgi:hypothetical protein
MADFSYNIVSLSSNLIHIGNNNMADAWALGMGEKQISWSGKLMLDLASPVNLGLFFSESLRVFKLQFFRREEGSDCYWSLTLSWGTTRGALTH